jgi:hypothetical protein
VLGDRLGSGGMGEVRLGHLADGSDERPVAVKLLRPELAGDTEQVTFFLQEARLLRGLRHPNVVRVLDLVAEGETLAIVMEYVPGGDLRRAVPFPAGAEVVRDLLCQVADGLAAIHAAGIVHRDLKPENVLVDDGTARVSDFGISHRKGSWSARRRGVVGSAGYMSPECAQGLPVGPEADVYALGVMMYEMLTGARPFVAGNEYAVLRAHLKSPVPRPPSMAGPWWDLVSRMLAKEPDDRPRARQVALALRGLPVGPEAAGEQPATGRDRPPARWKRLARTPLVVGAAAVAAAVLAGGIGMLLAPGDQEREPARDAGAAQVPPIPAGTPSARRPVATAPTTTVTATPYTPPGTVPPSEIGTIPVAVFPPERPTLTVESDPDADVGSDSQVSLRIDGVVAGSGAVATIVVDDDSGGSRPVRSIPGISGPYRTTVTGLVNGAASTFTVRVCNTFGKCATSDAVQFTPFGLPVLGALRADRTGLRETLTVPPVDLNGNLHIWRCQVTASTSIRDGDAPDGETVSADGGTITWRPHLLRTYTAQEICSDGPTVVKGPVLTFRP